MRTTTNNNTEKPIRKAKAFAMRRLEGELTSSLVSSSWLPPRIIKTSAVPRLPMMATNDAMTRYFMEWIIPRCERRSGFLA